MRLLKHILLLFAFSVFVSCDGEGFLVYTSVDMYSDLQNIGININDGYYVLKPLTDSQYGSLNKTGVASHRWLEKDIYNWLVGRGFGYTEANAVSKYIITEKHCLVYSRMGNLVYSIVK